MFPTDDGGNQVYKKQSNKWVLTVFEPERNAVVLVDLLNNLYSSGDLLGYFWGCEECPTTGNLHIHVGMVFPHNWRYNKLTALLSSVGIVCWKKPMKGTFQQAYDYVDKMETQDERFPIPMYHVEYPPSNQKESQHGSSSSSDTQNRKKRRLTDEQATMLLTGDTATLFGQLDPQTVLDNRRAIKESMELVPQRSIAPVVIWIYGATGTGKSTFVEALAQRLNLSAHWQGTEENANFWNGYHGQEIVVLEEARESTLPFQMFLRLAQNKPYNVNIKTTHRAMDSPLIVVTAPSPPWSFWKGTVNQPGHTMDINQVMRRINVVVEMLSPSESRTHLVDLLRPWEVNSVFNDPQPQLSLDQQQAAALYHHVLNDHQGFVPQENILHCGNSSVMSNVNECEISLSSMRTVAAVTHPMTKYAALPVVTRMITLTGSSSAQMYLEEAPIHWTETIRMPSGMNEEQKHALMQAVCSERKLTMKFCVRSRSIDQPCQEIMLDHYFDEFFNAES